MYRIVFLDSLDKNFLNQQSDNQSIHNIKVSATRGIIFDRNEYPLAVSTTLYQLILDPKVLGEYPNKYPKLAALHISGINKLMLDNIITKYPKRRYFILSKNLIPWQASEIKQLHIPGVYLQKQMRSYYPENNAAAQLVGFTNFNNAGQYGMEYTYNNILRAHSSNKVLATDPKGNIIKTIHPLKNYHQGKDIHLSINAMIQYFTYQALKKGVKDAEANSGAAVVMDPHTGEVLAVASYPSFNPNVFNSRSSKNIAERAIIDTFEPGSTIKPFIVAMGLESGKYTPDTTINTSPGWYYIGKNKIRDDSNFGTISVTKVLQKSSNVGVSKIALSISKTNVYDFLQTLGFGGQTSYAFPGENLGYLPDLNSLSKFEYATLSFGYAMTTSVLQLAHAYTIFANNGKLCPISLVYHKNTQPKCQQVLPARTANEVLNMLNTVVNIHGTGVFANIPGFDVAGKTGTTHKVGNGGFLKNQYNAIFAGIAPLHNPRLVIAVWIDNPHKSHFYQFGGVSAAPIFASIASKSLAYMGIPYQQDLKNYVKLDNNKQWLMKIIESN